MNKKEKDKEYYKNLWEKIKDWWKSQHKFSDLYEFSKEIGWDYDEIKRSFLQNEIPPKLVLQKISEISGIEINNFEKNIKEAQKKIEKIKYLLIFLEEELSWFRDNPKEIIDILRENIDTKDLGYISSFLTMITDEEQFKRWLALTTNRFNYFRKK